jgi:hypothetical protein
MSGLGTPNPNRVNPNSYTEGYNSSVDSSRLPAGSWAWMGANDRDRGSDPSAISKNGGWPLFSALFEALLICAAIASYLPASTLRTLGIAGYYASQHPFTLTVAILYLPVFFTYGILLLKFQFLRWLSLIGFSWIVFHVYVFEGFPNTAYWAIPLLALDRFWMHLAMGNEHWGRFCLRCFLCIAIPGLVAYSLSMLGAHGAPAAPDKPSCATWRCYSN